MKRPEEYFFEDSGVEHSYPQEPEEAFAKRAEGFELWCHVCDGLTTYEEVSLLPSWNNYKPCPHCGLYATIQDIT